MAYLVLAYIVLAYTVMAHAVMAYIVMTHTVMAYVVMTVSSCGLCGRGMERHFERPV